VNERISWLALRGQGDEPADKLGTLAAGSGTMPENVVMELVAKLRAFLTDTNAKNGIIDGIYRVAFEGMKGAHANKCTFIQHFRDLPRKVSLRLRYIRQQVFTFQPGLETGAGMAACNNHF
jgi:hypothetical protein